VQEPQGIDPDGRERLSFVPGDVAVPPYPEWVQRDDALASVATLLRRFHDAAASFDPCPHEWSDEMADPLGGAIVCHNDVCLENVVFRDGAAVALLDFDFAAPGRPRFDLAAMARMCVPIDSDENAQRFGWSPADRPARLRVVADAYGLDRPGRDELVAILSAGIARSGEFVRRRAEAGDPNFARVWAEIGGMAPFDRRRAWWARERDRFARALA